jgi:hypothetical protein
MRYNRDIIRGFPSWAMFKSVEPCEGCSPEPQVHADDVTAQTTLKPSES